MLPQVSGVMTQRPQSLAWLSRSRCSFGVSTRVIADADRVLLNRDMISRTTDLSKSSNVATVDRCWAFTRQNAAIRRECNAPLCPGCSSPSHEVEGVLSTEDLFHLTQCSGRSRR